MNNLWSPHPPQAYTVMVDGVPAGLGAREEFVGRPGLWNMFWLHSTKVDTLLNWELPPEQAIADTVVLHHCIDSVSYTCRGIKFETLCEELSAEDLISRVMEKGCHPPIREFWDETAAGWYQFVTDRLKTYKSLDKKKGVVVQGKFPLQNKR